MLHPQSTSAIRKHCSEHAASSKSCSRKPVRRAHMCSAAAGRGWPPAASRGGPRRRRAPASAACAAACPATAEPRRPLLLAQIRPTLHVRHTDGFKGHAVELHSSKLKDAVKLAYCILARSASMHVEAQRSAGRRSPDLLQLSHRCAACR
jgi:hypothetical protein